MNLAKKILLGSCLVTTVVPAVFLLASCSNKEEVPFDTGISEETKNYYGEKITTQLATTPEAVLRKTMLITTGGPVTDKSFNESTWEAIKLYANQINQSGSDDFTFRQTETVTELPRYYDEAISGGFKTIVLTGFQQGVEFENWLKIPNNEQKFINSKAVVVGVDWDGSSFIPQGQFLGLGFKTNETAWIVGRAAAEFLIKTNRTPHLSSFGGATYNGVTDFNNGFLQGMYDWNVSQELNNQKVKFYSGDNEANSINLSTTFIDNTDTQGIVDKIVGTNENAPQIILPVAGALTTTTLTNIQRKQSSQMIIGVDSNQALVFPNDKDMFFSSIEKKVGVAVYKAMILLAGIPLDFVSGNQNDDGFQGAFKEVGMTNASNAFVKYGMDKDLVGFSLSTLAGNDGKVANDALANAKQLFESNPPTFRDMTNAANNQRLLDELVVLINKRL